MLYVLTLLLRVVGFRPSNRYVGHLDAIKLDLRNSLQFERTVQIFELICDELQF